jgi:AcrR family transcriptional regulator
MSMNDGQTRRTIGVRTGGRSERVVTAVVRATLDEIGRVGYAPLRVEDVATRAGVNKTSVYRRWPTKSALVGAAIRMIAGFAEALPDSGSARSDLVALTRRALQIAATPDGRAIARLLTNQQADPEVDAIGKSVREEARRRRMSLLERAQGRGELPADVDVALVLDAIFAPVMTRVYTLGETVDDATVVRLVDLVITGVEHGAGRRTA